MLHPPKEALGRQVPEGDSLQRCGEMSRKLNATSPQVGTGQAGVEGWLAGEVAGVPEAIDTCTLWLTLLQTHVVPRFARQILNHMYARLCFPFVFGVF